MWYAITYPCLRYLLLAPKSSNQLGTHNIASTKQSTTPYTYFMGYTLYHNSSCMLTLFMLSMSHICCLSCKWHYEEAMVMWLIDHEMQHWDLLHSDKVSGADDYRGFGNFGDESQYIPCNMHIVFMLFFVVVILWVSSEFLWSNYLYFFRVCSSNNGYGSGHGTVAVLLPGFAINW